MHTDDRHAVTVTIVYAVSLTHIVGEVGVQAGNRPGITVGRRGWKRDVVDSGGIEKSGRTKPVREGNGPRTRLNETRLTVGALAPPHLLLSHLSHPLFLSCQRSSLLFSR